MVPYLLPAGWVAEVPLAEDDPVERSRELQVHRHPALLARDVQPGDLDFFTCEKYSQYIVDCVP